MMKKLLLLILALLVGNAVASAESDKWINGDANVDGKIDVTDLTALMNEILGNEGETWNMYWDPCYILKNEKDTKCYLFGDLNYDGNRDVSDITLMLQMILGSKTPDTVWELEEKKTFTVNGVSFDMIYVHGGSFQMGGTDEQGGDAYANEYPTHKVTLDGYYIGKTEVTQALWVAVMGSGTTTEGKWNAGLGDNYPAYNCTWSACNNFINKLAELTGENFRFPTEAEWEFAARGGNNSKGYKYSGSNDCNQVGWTNENSGGLVHEVGQKMINELGIFDMTGNLWEWVHDWYNTYSDEDQVNPTGPDSPIAGSWATWKVDRGGSYLNVPKENRVSRRAGVNLSTRLNNVGFRLAK